jgi:hypothetical protein
LVKACECGPVGVCQFDIDALGSQPVSQGLTGRQASDNFNSFHVYAFSFGFILLKGSVSFEISNNHTEQNLKHLV